jgi:hypothetical protein
MARKDVTRKELILRMVQRLPDDVTYARVIYHLDVMNAIETGIEQIERGEFITHEELERQLREKGWLDAPASSGPKKRGKTSIASSASQPPRLPAIGAGLHEPDSCRG